MRSNYLLKVISLLALTLPACALVDKKPTHSGSINKISVSLSINSYDSLIVVSDSYLFNYCIPSKTVLDERIGSYFMNVGCSFRQIPDTVSFNYYILSSAKDKDVNFGRVQYHDDIGRDFFNRAGQRVTREEWWEEGINNRYQLITQLPPSAWKSYDIDLKNIINKYKNVEPQGKPMLGVVPFGRGVVLGSPFGSLHNRHLNLEVIIDNNGNVTLKENYHWENPVPNNPYT